MYVKEGHDDTNDEEAHAHDRQRRPRPSIRLLFLGALCRKGLSHRLLKIGHRRWIVFQKELIGSNGRQRIKVLTEQENVHDVLGCGSFHLVGEF